METKDELIFLISYIPNIFLGLCQLFIMILGILMLSHALRQPADAFALVNRISKPFWLLILGVGTFLSAICGYISLTTVGSDGTLIVTIIVAVAVLVYSVEIKPKIDDITHKPRY